MPHANSPLTPEGKRRLIERLETGRPIAHVADDNHERPHSALGYKPPASLAPSDFRLEPQPMQWPAVEIPRATSDDYLF